MVISVLLVLSIISVPGQTPWISVGENGRLIYAKDSTGNRVPDFSYCGYKASEEAIPDVETKVFIPATDQDATGMIQQAIDFVSALPLDGNGFRGAVQLDRGTYYLKGRLMIQSSGVVIRGKGLDENGTRLIAGGKDRQTLIRILGKNQYQYGDSSVILNDVPVNGTSVVVSDPERFDTGMRVIIHRASTQEWIEKLGMDHFGGRETGYIGWKPGQRDVKWERIITNISGDTLYFDVPLTLSLNQEYGESHITPFLPTGRIGHIGVENLMLESEYDPANPLDEEHCFSAITIENCENAWVRRVQFTYFAGSAVAIYETARKITVEDCISLDPVSEIANWRRTTFFTMGQQTLFQRLYAESGYHDFAVGFGAAGPNAFVECESYLPHNFSGTIDSWATGVLFDVVKIDGHRLSFSNRMIDHQGAGWTAANSVFWQCSADRIENFAPPGAMNYAFGVWGQFVGNGYWFAQNNHVRPRSLYYAQLADRLGHDLSEFQDEIRPVPGPASTSPTLEQAMNLTKEAWNPHLRMDDWIRQRMSDQPLKTSSSGAHLPVSLKHEAIDTIENHPPITMVNGYLTCQGELMAGRRYSIPYWRGVARPYEADLGARPAITRFVPGRNGPGYSDNLEEVVKWMEEQDIVGIEHNYGLWYDRRRDDHQRVRRMDGQVWAPFYEQPFVRSGIGTAWDGLSRYDLTRFSHFYWSRLKEFASLAGRSGRILLQHHFFQHNILEAGAHWADSPWRPVNNINQTGFIEPVNYAGDKRIFIADQFYNINSNHQRELYRNYIRQCLGNFDEHQPVFHLISAEYTGPLHFVEFWLDEIHEWQQETNREAWIVLSTTKDVQDAILSQPERVELVDVIDIRYWASREDGTTYAPPGGKHMSPRQHARIESSGKRSFHSVYQSIFGYRQQFPDKAVIYSEGQYDRFGWAILFAGGSLPVLPVQLPEGLTESFLSMKPDYDVIIPERFYLNHNNHEAIAWLNGVDSFIFEHAVNKEYLVTTIDVTTGDIIREVEVYGGINGLRVINSVEGPVVIWIRRL